MRGWIVVSLVALCACGGTKQNESGFSNDAGSGTFGEDSGMGGSDDGGPGFAPGTDSGTSSSNGCSAASQLIYVLSASNQIYSFNPQTKVFTPISSLQCQAGSMTPNSMAVDREGNAWVNYVGADPTSGNATSGGIFKVDIATGACTTTSVSLPNNWYQVGMGFSTVSASDTTDTLYVAATNGLGCLGGFGGGGGGASNDGLGTIDTTAMTFKKIGPFTGSLAGQSAELTGTGNGRLYGFFADTPAAFAQIDKTTGATSNEVSLTSVQCPAAYAFSFWGGDFYFYTSPDGTTNSTVTHYTTGDGGIDPSFVMDAGIVIVGAGVSTCAPTTQPPPM